ncbi:MULTISPECIES: S-Ena type endospore appendage [unclassified Priestia]|uniref:S-Ena type endospore appendage n=1 Tax=unclassified Priestia TaxID=2800374 RepID=UPI003671F139
MGKRAKKVYKSNSFSVIDMCPSSNPRSNLYDIVQNSLSGNILLNHSIKNLEIWREEICGKSTVTLSVFNSSISTSFIKATINRYIQCPIEFTVPPGNTLSVTAEDAKSIMISKECTTSILEGKYCLEISFATSPSRD